MEGSPNFPILTDSDNGLLFIKMAKKEHKNFHIRREAVETYLAGGTLRQVAQKYKIHPITLHRWVKWYQNNRFSDSAVYIRPWNRTSLEIERKVMLLKENHPSISLSQAQQVLRKKGIMLSTMGIYRIWQRYNLGKRPEEDPLSPLGMAVPETECVMKYIKNIMNKKTTPNILKTVADILNNLPTYPSGYEDIIKDVPMRYLSSRRKLDYLTAQLGEILSPQLLKKFRDVRGELERQGYYYSAIFAGMMEILLTEWMRLPEETLRLYNILIKRIKGLRIPEVRFSLKVWAAIACVELLYLRKARKFTQECRRMTMINARPHYWEFFGDLMTFWDEYRVAQRFYYKVLVQLKDEEERRNLKTKIVNNHIMAGEYRQAEKILRRSKISSRVQFQDTYYLMLALINFRYARFERMQFYIQKALEIARQHRFRNTIYVVTICLAAMNRALGRKKAAHDILRRNFPLFKKYSVKSEIMIIKCLYNKNFKMKTNYKKLPTLKLLDMLKKTEKTLKARDYNRIFEYAYKKGLTGVLHRYLVFFPAPVRHLLNRNKKTGLPRAILQFPIFNRKIPIFYIKFLGNLVIYRNQKYLRIRLQPKEKAFLIYLSFKMGEPRKSIPVIEVYSNFWPKSKNPSSLLSHLLVKIRKALHLSGHILYITGTRDGQRIVNQGFYIKNDFRDFEITLAQARALARAGEWGYARKKFLEAFQLFRGRPFERMYDNWSEDMRQVVLNSLEHGVQDFIQICAEHRNRKDAMRIKQKFLRIISREDS